MSSNHPLSKIIITGTGRAGTTFLVRLLTELGFDTGFDRNRWQRHVHAHCSAGMEWDLADPAAPRVVKNPDLCVRLGALLASGTVAVERAVIPVRDLDSAAASRVRVGVGAPGGVIGTEDPAQQRAVLAGRFHQLIETLAAHAIPVTFLHFPRFATDAEYCYVQLRPLLGDIGWPEFEAAFARVSEPALIHDFKKNETFGEVGNAALQFRQSERRRRLARKIRSVAALAAVLAAGFYLGAISVDSPASVQTAADVEPDARGAADRAVGQAESLTRGRSHAAGSLLIAHVTPESPTDPATVENRDIR